MTIDNFVSIWQEEEGGINRLSLLRGFSLRLVSFYSSIYSSNNGYRSIGVIDKEYYDAR